LKFKFNIGDLVIFQKPNMTYTEWKQVDDYPYVTGMITFREKSGATSVVDEFKHSYYHVLLPDGNKYYSQREDKLALLAQSNP